MWDEITYPFPSFGGSPFEVWEWISDFIAHLMMSVYYLSMLGLKLNHNSKGGNWWFDIFFVIDIFIYMYTWCKYFPPDRFLPCTFFSPFLQIYDAKTYPCPSFDPRMLLKALGFRKKMFMVTQRFIIFWEKPFCTEIVSHVNIGLNSVSHVMYI